MDLSPVKWLKSSHSNGDGGYCVEVAEGLPGLVPVRDSKTAAQQAPVLLFRPTAWAAFLTSLR
ncbi:DUF397 domain-containing protein [Streptomyces sp. PSKA30]|uniref:DUF397 domain-containing protein n=1 Tax=Streptomyces sp. PSKA30 TaxID=2874597 RepID=UPI0035AFC0A8